jgi:hypothetical protein
MRAVVQGIKVSKFVERTNYKLPRLLDSTAEVANKIMGAIKLDPIKKLCQGRG